MNLRLEKLIIGWIRLELFCSWIDDSYLPQDTLCIHFRSHLNQSFASSSENIMINKVNGPIESYCRNYVDHSLLSMGFFNELEENPNIFRRHCTLFTNKVV